MEGANQSFGDGSELLHDFVFDDAGSVGSALDLDDDSVDDEGFSDDDESSEDEDVEDGYGDFREGVLDIYNDEKEEKDAPAVLSQETLLRIKRHDPDVSSLEVRGFGHNINGDKGAGHFVGESRELKRLLVKGEFMEWEDDFPKHLDEFRELCEGVARNRSLEHLLLRDCYLTGGAAMSNTNLLQFCVLNNNLQSLEIMSCDLEDEGTRLLAKALSARKNKGSLQRVNLFSNGIGDNAGKDLVESLADFENLSQFSLGKNYTDTETCYALAKLLSSPKTQLKELVMEHNWIGDVALTLLAKGLESNATLEELNLKRNPNASSTGWRAFATCLENPNSALELLDLGNNILADEGIIAIGNALANNSTLRVLDFSFRGHPFTPVSAAGWRCFFSSLQNSESVVDEIHLRGNGIDDERLLSMGEVLTTNSKIKILDISNNPQPSQAGWDRFFAACLRPPRSVLEGLFLCENNLTDEVVCDLARALEGNKRMEALDLGENPNITKRGWSRFADLLCDSSSIARASASNHTLEYFGPQRLPMELASLVQMNQHPDKSDVAREKILRYCFLDGSKNMDQILDMSCQVLPHAMSWLSQDSSCSGRESTGSTVLYKLLRSMPTLFQGSSLASSGSKRKRAIDTTAVPNKRVGRVTR